MILAQDLLDGVEGLEDETVGLRVLRTEVALLAETWHWSEPDILRMEISERRAYLQRALHFLALKNGKHKDPSTGYSEGG